VDLFMVSAYRSKTVIVIAVAVNLLYLGLACTLSHVEGVYDDTGRIVTQDYAKHLEIVFGNCSIIKAIIA